MSSAAKVEPLLRAAAPRVLAALVRRHGDFATCEDAVQEALLTASRRWPVEGVPTDPVAWLITVGRRRIVDVVRSERARRDREVAVAVAQPADRATVPDAGAVDVAEDDTLLLLFLCCHPALTPPSQVALTLRAVGGLTTEEVARAFLVPAPTVERRITRAKRTIEAAGARFEHPPPDDLDARVAAVCQVLYLVFNEGYTASSGTELVRRQLTAEAIRLTREVHRLLPDDGEVAGLLALMLLTDARRAARVAPDGSLVPLADQDRSLWDTTAMAEGTELIATVLEAGPVGPYQVQAAIAAVHAEALEAERTDWPQIAALYRVLAWIAPSPVVTLNQAVAVAMVEGPAAGLALLAPLERDDRLSRYHRLAAVRGHLLELAGETAAAREAYRVAARLTTSVPERRYLETRAGRLPTP